MLHQIENKHILGVNRVLDADSYKLSHYKMYPKNVEGMFCYIEARSKGDTIIPFGITMWIRKMFSTRITIEEIDEAENFAEAHGEPFNREAWDYLLEKYNGWMPVIIKSVPEGMHVPSGEIIASIECTDPKLYWLASYLETSFQRAIWYPTTIASNGHKAYNMLKDYLRRTSDKPEHLEFMLHDFGARGVSSEESAQIGGAAHLIHFSGSDNISGVRAANFYYGRSGDMFGYSVPATEHSIQCAYSADSSSGMELDYLQSVLDTAEPGKILSIVIDAYCTRTAVALLCQNYMRDKIINSGAKIVIRPDSGDPLEIIPEILETLLWTFKATTNSKGYGVLNHVGIIWGDGLDLDDMQAILDKVIDNGYSADNIVFGSGGGLLQKVNRDTYKFAQKASAVLVDGEWQPICKDPVDSPWKKSKPGHLGLFRTPLGLSTSAVTNKNNEDNILITFYINGVRNFYPLSDTDLRYSHYFEDIRKRARNNT